MHFWESCSFQMLQVTVIRDRTSFRTLGLQMGYLSSTSYSLFALFQQLFMASPPLLSISPLMMRLEQIGTMLMSAQYPFICWQFWKEQTSGRSGLGVVWRHLGLAIMMVSPDVPQFFWACAQAISTFDQSMLLVRKLEEQSSKRRVFSTTGKNLSWNSTPSTDQLSMKCVKVADGAQSYCSGRQNSPLALTLSSMMEWASENFLASPKESLLKQPVVVQLVISLCLAQLRGIPANWRCAPPPRNHICEWLGTLRSRRILFLAASTTSLNSLELELRCRRESGEKSFSLSASLRYGGMKVGPPANVIGTLIGGFIKQQNLIINLTMVDMLQEQFSSLVWRIKNTDLKGRTEQIRVKEWVKKLSCAVSNQMWRRNRNLYARVLVIMLESGVLQTPFNRNPPEGPLGTLTPPDIPFEVRNELQRREEDGKPTRLNWRSTSIDKGKQPIYKMRCKQQHKMQDRLVKEEGQQIAALIQSLLQDSADFLQSRHIVGDVGTLLEEIHTYTALRRYQV